MEKYLDFYIEDNYNDERSIPRIIKSSSENIIQRYDYNKKDFVEDVDMLGIYIGKIDVIHITEEQAMKYIDFYTKKYNERELKISSI